MSTCGRCEYCLTGREQRCQSKHITGGTVDGGHAEYVLAKAEHAYPVPESLPDTEAAPLFCPGITAYGAVSKAHLAPGKRMVLFGMGGVGHLVLQFAKLHGAEVIVVSRSRQHLRLAEELGASKFGGVAALKSLSFSAMTWISTSERCSLVLRRRSFTWRWVTAVTIYFSMCWIPSGTTLNRRSRWDRD